MKPQYIIKKLTLSNLCNGFLIVSILVVILNPTAKALTIRGLMKVGFFQPDLTQHVTSQATINMPDLILESRDREIINLKDQKGKVVFMNFWATWCPPCIAEMPSINDLAVQLKDNKNIQFITVDADQNFSKSIPFMRKHHFVLPLYKAKGEIPFGLFGKVIPTTLIFDKKGKRVFYHEGAADYGAYKMQAYLIKLSK